MKLFFYGLLCFAMSMQASDLHFSVQAQQTAKIPLGLAFVGKKSKNNITILDRLQKDLQYSGQCTASKKMIPDVKKITDMSKLFPAHVYLALFVTKVEQGYEWRLYDLLSSEMIAGQKTDGLGLKPDMIAHKIADQVWPNLMNKKSSFCSKIAYCKQIWKTKQGREKPYKQIWVTDFDGSNPQLFIDVPTVSFAPRWSMQSSCPLLFYSENTVSNVQLVMSNMFGKRHVMCSFDGLNMQPTFSQDGKEVVFCLSKDGSSQLYHSYIDGLSKERKCDRLTYNEGNNIAPCFVDDNHVAFITDFETPKPQVYILNVVNHSLQRITDGAYCACPAYCSANNKLVYSKMIDGTMQLCQYDCSTHEHKQLTKCSGNKEEPTWSACGNYIVFGLNEGLKSKVAQLNLVTNKIKPLTASSEHCTYPSCSPVYDTYIGVLGI